MSKFVSMMGFLVVLTSLLASTANAQARPVRPGQPVPAAVSKSVGKVDIRMQVVHANNSGVVDPDLKAVAANFKAYRYTGFQKLESVSARLTPNEDEQFSVVGGHKIRVKLVSRDSRQAKVRVMIFNESGKVMDTTVAINRNRAFMIAGTSYKDGKLILPITVRY